MGQERYRDGFNLRVHPEVVKLPLSWRKPQMIFVNSMSDLFHERVSDAFIRRVFATMQEAKQHTFQILTKRGAARVLAPGLTWAPNIWMGVTVEAAQYVNRVECLREVGAAVRFLSMEPLLGMIPDLPLEGIHWVIVGGESGPGRGRCNSNGQGRSETNASPHRFLSSSSSGAGFAGKKRGGCWTIGCGMTTRPGLERRRLSRLPPVGSAGIDGSRGAETRRGLGGRLTACCCRQATAGGDSLRFAPGDPGPYNGGGVDSGQEASSCATFLNTGGQARTKGTSEPVPGFARQDPFRFGRRSSGVLLGGKSDA